MDNDSLGKDYAYVAFVSASNGRGRKRRKRARSVELIVNRREKKAVALKDVPTGRVDAWAQEALDGQVDDRDDKFVVFVARLKALAVLGQH